MKLIFRFLVGILVLFGLTSCSGTFLPMRGNSPEHQIVNYGDLVPGPDQVRFGYVTVRTGFEGFVLRNLLAPTHDLRKMGYIVEREDLHEGPVPPDVPNFYRIRNRQTGEYLGYITIEDAKRLVRGEQVRMVPARYTRRDANFDAPPRAEGQPTTIPSATFVVYEK